MGLAVGKESIYAPSLYSGLLKVKHGMTPTTSQGKFNNSTNCVSKCEGFFLALLWMCICWSLQKALCLGLGRLGQRICTDCSSLSDSGLASSIFHPVLFLNCKAAGRLVPSGIGGIEDFVQGWMKSKTQ